MLLYHGANRKNRLFEPQEYDFVITTSTLVEKEYVGKHCICGQPMPEHSKTFDQQNPSPSKSSNITSFSNTKHISSMRKGGSSPTKFETTSNLYSVKWQHIILDEVILCKLDHPQHICYIYFLVWWHKRARHDSGN